MTNQPEERDMGNKSTNVGQQQHGNTPNDKAGQTGQTGQRGQQQQSQPGQGQQSHSQQGSGKGGQQK